MGSAPWQRAPWWPELVGDVARIVRESGDPRGFDASVWLAEFLRAPSPALGGRTLQAFVHTAEGRAHVVRLLGQMQSSAYV